MAASLRKALSDWHDPEIMSAVLESSGDYRGDYGFGRPAHGSDPDSAYGFGFGEPEPAPFKIGDYIKSRRAMGSQAG